MIFIVFFTTSETPIFLILRKKVCNCQALFLIARENMSVKRENKINMTLSPPTKSLAQLKLVHLKSCFIKVLLNLVYQNCLVWSCCFSFCLTYLRCKLLL